jgi:hypothetical protein
MAKTCSGVVIVVHIEILHLKWTHKQMAVYASEALSGFPFKFCPEIPGEGTNVRCFYFYICMITLRHIDR